MPPEAHGRGVRTGAGGCPCAPSGGGRARPPRSPARTPRSHVIPCHSRESGREAGIGLMYPFAQRLRRASELRRHRGERRPLRVMFTPDAPTPGALPALALPGSLLPVNSSALSPPKIQQAESPVNPERFRGTLRGASHPASSLELSGDTAAEPLQRLPEVPRPAVAFRQSHVAIAPDRRHLAASLRATIADRESIHVARFAGAPPKEPRP